MKLQYPLKPEYFSIELNEARKSGLITTSDLRLIMDIEITANYNELLQRFPPYENFVWYRGVV